MSTPFDFFTYRKGQLCAQGVPLAQIARETGTPVYVYSADAFLKPLRVFKSALASIDPLVCYAMKSNSNVAIVHMLAEAGAGMDLVSGGELHRAGLAGVDAEKIVFSGVGKSTAEMRMALRYGQNGIFSFNVESVAELQLLSKIAQEVGRTARVALRFNPDVDAKTHPYISTGLKKNKFGLQRQEVLEVIRKYKRFPGVEIRGLSIHIGSQLLSLAPIANAFIKVHELVEEAEKILPQPLSYVDLGGGVGITYKNEKAPPLEKYCTLILKHFGPKSEMGGRLKIVLEPGRVFSGNAGILLTEVMYRKERGKKDFLVLDAAMNDLIRPALYGSYHEIVAVEEARSRGARKKTDVVGPVCETGDCFGSDRNLSASLTKGDLVAILSAGAYGFTMASNYNSRPRPPEVLVRNKDFKVIRERESYEDLVRGESL